MKALIATILLLVMTGCAQGVHLAQARTAADVGEAVINGLDHAVAAAGRPRKDQCVVATDGDKRAYLQCMAPLVKAAKAIAVAFKAHETLVASADGSSLVEDNPGGAIACFAEAVSHAIAAAQAAGVNVDSVAARNWARLAGTIGTMCLYSTDATLGHGSAEGE